MFNLKKYFTCPVVHGLLLGASVLFCTNSMAADTAVLGNFNLKPGLFHNTIISEGSFSSDLRSVSTTALSITMVGAVANDPRKSIVPYLQKALTMSNVVKIPAGNWYGGATDASDEANVVKLGSNKTLIFESGAVWHFGQVAGSYLPALAVVSAHDVNIINPKFVWTGALKVSQNGDIRSADLSANPLVSRLGTPDQYRDDVYNSAILVISSANVYIKDLDVSSSSPSNPMLYALFTARTYGGYLVVDGLTANDVNMGCLSQGGDFAIYRHFHIGRMNQDIGSPGHGIYSYVSNSDIYDINDTGEETGNGSTGNVNGQFVSHTVSAKNFDSLIVSGINSRRAEGPLNIALRNGGTESVKINGIKWSDTGSSFSSRAGALYGVNNFKDSSASISISNIDLESKKDISLWAGHWANVSGSNVSLKKSVGRNAVKPYMDGIFSNNNIDVSVFNGGGPDEHVLHSGKPTDFNGNKIRVSAHGFRSSPSMDAGSDFARRNNIDIH